MINRLIEFLILLILLSSCDTLFHSKGVVIDNNTLKPIKGALIKIKGFDTTYTDSLGKFEVVKMIYGVLTNCEMIIEKKGYLPQYVNFSKDSYDIDSAVIKLQPTEIEFKPVIREKSIKFMYTFNKYGLSIFNILTLIYIIIIKGLKKRYLWIIGILLINFTFFFLYLDFSLIKFHLLNGPIYLTHYWMYPFSVKIVIPIISISFWSLYIFKREWIIKENI